MDLSWWAENGEYCKERDKWRNRETGASRDRDMKKDVKGGAARRKTGLTDTRKPFSKVSGHPLLIGRSG